MEIEKHEPEQPAPTFTLELSQSELDLIWVALDLAGTAPGGGIPRPELKNFQIVEMDGLYHAILPLVGFRDGCLERLGLLDDDN